jgi:hypothetical protein
VKINEPEKRNQKPAGAVADTSIKTILIQVRAASEVNSTYFYILKESDFANFRKLRKGV